MILEVECRCSKVFSYEYCGGRRRRWCSDSCRYSYYGNKKNDELRMRREADGRMCEICGRWYVKKQGETYSKYCGDTCRKEKRSRRFNEKIRKISSCKICGIEFSNLPGFIGRVCGDECHKEMMRSKWKRDRAKKRRRVANRGASERVSPLEIFVRDGWRCKHCGTMTPEKKRGTFSNNAPELDHIVPLSAGGEHSKVNLQLLCRKCNIKKGAGTLYDQTLLFG